MSNSISAELMAQLMAESSNDPFLTLLTLTHESFSEDILLVNNSVAITSQSRVFQPFPVKIKLPNDDDETRKEFTIQFDNVSLELIDEIRSVTTPINCKLEMVLASIPNDIQMTQENLTIQSITYNSRFITAKLVLDNFLSTEISSEKYRPTNFPGLF